VIVKAPAKINLTLRILSKRADGYHEISSLMRAIRLFDEVEIDFYAAGINVSSDAEGVPEGPDNLAYKAAELILGKSGGIDIFLRKRIPTAAGLAGGSADAAAVLLALANDKKLDDIAALGAKLGMDVPFCVYTCAAANPELGYKGFTAMAASGAGEELTPVNDPEKAWIVLVKPQIEIPTKQVYDLYDIWNGPTPDSENDLEAPCADAWPVVGETIAELKNICGGDVKVQLSGSGPTVFAYFKDEAEAERVFDRSKSHFTGMAVYLTETF